MKVYKPLEYVNRIDTLDAERITDKSVWINGRRHARKSNYGGYFLTYKEARDYIIQHHEQELRKAEKRVIGRQKVLEEAERLPHQPEGGDS